MKSFVEDKVQYMLQIEGVLQVIKLRITTGKRSTPYLSSSPIALGPIRDIYCKGHMQGKRKFTELLLFNQRNNIRQVNSGYVW